MIITLYIYTYMHMNTVHTHKRHVMYVPVIFTVLGLHCLLQCERESCYPSHRTVCKVRETGNRKLRMNALLLMASMAAASNDVFVINTTMFLKWKENGSVCVVLSWLPSCFFTPVLTGIKFTAKICICTQNKGIMLFEVIVLFM